MVVLDSDVAARFPDDDAVNSRKRSLVPSGTADRTDNRGVAPESTFRSLVGIRYHRMLLIKLAALIIVPGVIWFLKWCLFDD